MNWLLIIVAIVALVVLFKFKEVQHKFWLVLFAGLLLFGAITVGHVYKTHDVDLSTFDGVLSLSKLYMVWLGQIGHNVADVGGYAVKKDWNFDDNSTTAPVKK